MEIFGTNKGHTSWILDNKTAMFRLLIIIENVTCECGHENRNIDSESAVWCENCDEPLTELAKLIYCFDGY